MRLDIVVVLALVYEAVKQLLLFQMRQVDGGPQWAPLLGIL